jgi:hypothetical protein
MTIDESRFVEKPHPNPSPEGEGLIGISHARRFS